MNDEDDDYPFKGGPFSKDTLEEPSSKESLSEKDFIKDGRSSNKGMPGWLWLFLMAVIALLVLGLSNWQQELMTKDVKVKPFLNVTNRQFSLFLWQFPSFLRANVKKKTGYLTGFQYENGRYTMNVSEADDIVVAPPDLLFLYHTWDRLLRPEDSLRSISSEEFLEFLSQVNEWRPENWKAAPDPYKRWLETLQMTKHSHLEDVSKGILPVDVRLAFQGWKNYFKEGPAINQLEPTVEQIQKFLKRYPHYSRSFWRNIQEVAGQRVAGENYLKFLLTKELAEEDIPASSQLSSFLKVAMFNEEQASKGL